MNPAKAAAQLIRARRVEVGPERVDARRLLSPRQRAVWDCTARLIKLLCGRRAGKTYWACVWLLAGAMERDNSLNVYIALTRGSAELISWAPFKEVGAAMGLSSECFNDARLRIKLPNGSQIIVTGSDDRKTIENWRGPKIYRAVVDEMGSQMPDVIEYFVTSILWPATADHHGSIALLGTPGLVCEGYWWSLTSPQALLEDPAAFSWDILANPFFEGRAQSVLDETLREVFHHDTDARDENGEALPLPLQFRREWLAEWVQDAGALVYPFDLARNGLLALPEVSVTGSPIPRLSWRYVIGHDVGVVDECAWVTWAYNPAWRGAVAVSSMIEQLDPDPAAVRTQQLLEDTRALGVSVELVLDTGGMGKAHERIYRQKYALPIVPAEKQGKASAIRELRGDLQSGAAQVLNGPECNPLRAQWAVLGWDDKKLVHNPRQPDHLADAALYGYRRVRHWSVAPDKHRPKPPLASPERFVYEQERAMERRAREYRERHDRRGGRLDR